LKGRLQKLTLSELRAKSGLKVQKIAEQLGVSRSNLYFIETAKTRPDKLKIEKLALIYNCSEEEIKTAWEEKKNEKIH
jgi:transcriptional regulator with XRE-family HTH domain